MKKFITLILLSLILINCTKEDEELTILDPDYNTPFNKLLREYNLYENNINYESVTPSKDMSSIFFSGRIKNDLYIKEFDTLTKQNTFNWSRKNILDTIVNIDKGFGEFDKKNINSFSIATPIKTNINSFSFILWGWDKNDKYTYGRQAYYSDLYFINNNDLKTYRTYITSNENYFFYNLKEWFDGSVIVRYDNTKNYNLSKYECFSNTGEKLFECDYGDSSEIILNQYEYIGFNNGKVFKNNIDLSINQSWYINLFENIEQEYRIDDYIITRDNDFIRSKIDYTLINGNTGVINKKISIETGKIID